MLNHFLQFPNKQISQRSKVHISHIRVTQGIMFGLVKTIENKYNNLKMIFSKLPTLCMCSLFNQPDRPAPPPQPPRPALPVTRNSWTSPIGQHSKNRALLLADTDITKLSYWQGLRPDTDDTTPHLIYTRQSMPNSDVLRKFQESPEKVLRKAFRKS